MSLRQAAQPYIRYTTYTLQDSNNQVEPREGRLRETDGAKSC